MTLAYSDRGPMSEWVWIGCKRECKSWPACRQQPTQQVSNRYGLVLSGAANQSDERSKPSGPSTFISQLSFARDPTIDTRHSPGLTPSTCSMRATISPRVRESPVFCISTLAAMSPNYCTKRPGDLFMYTTGSKPMNVAVCRVRRRAPGSQRTSRAIAVSHDRAPLKWSFTISAAENGAAGKNVFLLGKPALRRRERGKNIKAVTLVML
jgi:hypothetical protein